MRIFGRHDAFLVGGLAVTLWAVSSRQLGTLLDYGRDIDNSRGLQLVPGLFILAVVFVVHLVRKREDMRLEAAQATSRAAEMERLVAFGQSLARALDGDSIRAATSEHLPALASGRDVWAMVRTGGGWIPLTAIPEQSRTAFQRMAARALADPGASTTGHGDGAYWLPMIVGGTAIGVIGIAPEPPLTEAQRSVLTAAAALLAACVKNAELFNEVHENSVRDALTGCFNRRHSMDVLDAELRRARRSRSTFSLVMFDLDRFKEINDEHGHLCGDAVLAQVAHRMKAVLRGSDLKCRWGGEEFLVLLPDTPLEPGARHVAEMLRRDLEEHPIHWNDHTVVITASFGITEVLPGEDDANDMIGRADYALYQAKQLGRNRVMAAEMSAAQAV